MLQELRVENFALIREAALDFGLGLNVLTGETGAGKSILVDSMKLLLGGRAEARSLRKGAALGRVEGVFQYDPDSPAAQALAELGLATDEGLLILTRELGRGKNTCRINRRTVTLRDFQQVSRHLINIFGQHDHVELTDPARQLELVDSLGDRSHQARLEAVTAAYRRTRQSARHMKAFIEQASERETRRRRAEAALAELTPLKLVAGEEAEVAARFGRIMAAEALQEELAHAYDALYDSEGAAQARVREALEAIERAARIEASFQPLAKELQSALITIEETAHSLLDQGAAPEPGEAERLSERMELYERLRRKYGKNVDELIAAMALWEADIASDEGAALELEALRDRYLSAKADYEREALALRASRQAIARRFEERLLAELSDLAMAHARFEVAFGPAPAGARGEDQVTFMLSANPGSDLAPLHEIASGGEMSRIMLAFKTILAGVQGVETLIFDEIDTGIGGITLNAVADKLARVAAGEQVICVTHAAPIAARATTHFYIAKETDGAHTDMTVRRLQESERNQEIARMVGGEEAWHLAYAERLRADGDPKK